MAAVAGEGEGENIVTFNRVLLAELTFFIEWHYRKYYIGLIYYGFRLTFQLNFRLSRVWRCTLSPSFLQEERVWAHCHAHVTYCRNALSVYSSQPLPRALVNVQPKESFVKWAESAMTWTRCCCRCKLLLLLGIRFPNQHIVLTI